MWFRSCCLALMVQAAVLDGLLFDVPPFGQDGFASAAAMIGRRVRIFQPVPRQLTHKPDR